MIIIILMINIKVFQLVDILKLLKKMLNGIEVRLNCDYFENKQELDTIAEKLFLQDL